MSFPTCMVFLLGHPRVGKRTVGTHLAERLDAVLVDNQLINIPLLTLFKWDGKSRIPSEIWDRVVPIREAVLGTIEDLAPKSFSYVFTYVLEEGDEDAEHYDRIRSPARNRGSLFLSVMLDCDVDEQSAASNGSRDQIPRAIDAIGNSLRCSSRRRTRCLTSTPRPPLPT